MTVIEATLGHELISVGKQSTSIMYRLVKLCAEFEQTQEWALAGSATPAHWIASNLDVELATAREWLRIGKRLRELPACEAAFLAQRLSYSKIRSLTRIAKPENEDELCKLAETVPASQLNRELAWWSVRNEAAEEIDERHRRDRGLWFSTQPDGSELAIVKLHPIEGGTLKAAVDAELARHKPGASADAPSLAQQRVDALLRLLTHGKGKVVTEVVVHVRGDGCTLDDGTPVTDSSVAQIVPDSFIRALIHDADGHPINASGRQRHPTAKQKRVVKERDRGCVDCGSTDFSHYDHVPDFEVTKHTLVDELVLRCSRCHRKRHREEAA